MPVSQLLFEHQLPLSRDVFAPARSCLLELLRDSAVMAWRVPQPLWICGLLRFEIQKRFELREIPAKLLQNTVGDGCSIHQLAVASFQSISELSLKVGYDPSLPGFS
ncbi:MAG TPA: hypothetical protein VLI55_20500 [Bryobacteraceae bacterium]|nr:hypothetical protein [Bryobacteraceae bacterium]